MADKTYKLEFGLSDGTTQEVRFTVPQGEAGKSAYEYAKEAGYAGTEEEFAEKMAASDSSGSVSPEVIVAANSGTVVTATCGDKTVEGTAVDGICTLALPCYGEWAVSAGTLATSVTVDVVKQYHMDLFLFDNFSDNTWEKIIEVCQKNTVPDTWIVGNSKTMTVDGTDYQIDIIGKAHDDYADGSGKAPLTFQFHNSYPGGDSDSGDYFPWIYSDYRTTTMPKILANMPAAVRGAIKNVTKLFLGEMEELDTTADGLFLLSAAEYKGGYADGTQYAYYAAGNSAAKGYVGSSSKYAHCTRTPSVGDDGRVEYYYYVNSSGALVASGGTSVDFAPAFCF